MISMCIKPSKFLFLLTHVINYWQATAREASCGRGVDRHLFALYVTQASLQREESPFLKDALSMQYKLSTSQVLISVFILAGLVILCIVSKISKK